MFEKKQVEQKMTRKHFLFIALAAVASLAIFNPFTSQSATNKVRGSYGNNTYGG